MSAPRYTLVLGTFYILYPDLPNNGPEPDGDTISFLPDDDRVVRRLHRISGVAPDRRHLGTYAVRFESIDALETHFQGRHQNLELAHAARDAMLAALGFGHVEFLPTHPDKVRRAEHHPVRGHLLANGIESNGRVLGLVFPGEPAAPAVDGTRVFVDDAMLDGSVNAALVRAGLAYAELYSTMPLSLGRRVRELVTSARAAGIGLWPEEAVTTSTAARPGSVADLDSLVMFPKLYRRLVSYFTQGFADLAGFDAWVRSDPVHRDDRALLPDGEFGNLHDLYEVDADGLRLRYLPEELTFGADPAPVPVALAG